MIAFCAYIFTFYGYCVIKYEMMVLTFCTIPYFLWVYIFDIITFYAQNFCVFCGELN